MTIRLFLTIIGLAFSAASLSACGIFGGDKEDVRIEPTSSGVNGYLWRAAVETLSFMPMVDVDPRAGALITDWYVHPDVPNERMKVSAFILGGQLRADTLKVSVVRQVRHVSSIWVNEPLRAGTELKIEDAILKRARELRIDSLGN